MTGNRRNHFRTTLSIGLVTALLATGALPGHAATPPTSTESLRLPGSLRLPESPAPVPDNVDSNPAVVPDEDRDNLLGPGWQGSDDLAWTLAGDADGLRVLLAKRSEGYAWTHSATLFREGVETDRWIGNGCLTGDAQWLAIVYAPRSYTNDEALFRAGASAALVRVDSGEIVHLEGGYSLSYFNPGCGRADDIALTQFGGESRTRISVLTAANPHRSTAYEREGQLTGAVPSDGGAMAIAGNSIVRLTEDSTETLLSTRGSAFDLKVLPDRHIAYLQHDGERAQAIYHEHSGGEYGVAQQLADGELTSVGLDVSANGTAVISGTPSTTARSLPDRFVVAETDAPRVTLSSEAELIVEESDLPTTPSGAAMPSAEGAVAVEIASTSLATDKEVLFDVPPSGATTQQTATEGGATSSVPGPATSTGATVVASPTNPVSQGSPCAVPRNDPSIQALQPRPSEVEWYVDKAVVNTMNSMFPLPALNGGGKIPAQVMLGILAQESNFWQASRYSVPGVPGNPLIGNYYGADRFSSEPDAWWHINYPDADCGYGIAQVTDGMETGEMPYTQQLAIATNYQANISRGIQILIDKWNQTRAAGLTINDGNPMFLENWFYALWAYNTGFYPQGAAGQPWGVGWLNNPANNEYPANRTPFLDGSPADAANPQRWPYPEKVLGFAAHSAQFVDSVSSETLGDSYNYVAAFAPAWWPSSDGHNGVVNRKNVKPPLSQFCDASNSCDITQNGPAGPCLHTAGGTFTYQCWYNQPSTWKADCPSTCGQQTLSYINDPKPPAATSFPPACQVDTSLPAGAFIVDSVPSSVAPANPACSNRVTTTGSFQFNFAGDASNNWPSKIDLHQLGSGFNGQFYFSHTRIPGSDAAWGGALDIAGTWNLGQPLNGWAKVYVHMPSHGAWLQRAEYAVNTGLTTVRRSVNQRNYANEWVPLGAMQFAGTPTVTLTNNSANYTDTFLRDYLSGSDDVAWDAVAFLPLNQKPLDFIVSLGDSFSSGEGTSPHDGSGFLRGTDHHGEQITVGGLKRDIPHRNACHRSLDAWPMGMDPPNYPGLQSVKSMTESHSQLLDFHLLACSGGVTSNILPTENGEGGIQWHAEDTQLDRGFVDPNTTLVTLTIGGNDVGFGPVLNRCIVHTLTPPATPGAQCKDVNEPTLGPGTLEEEVNANLAALSADVSNVVQSIRAKAPTAKILVLGYPTLFESGSTCVSIADVNRTWLNSVADRLNKKLTEGVHNAGVGAEYQPPQYRFSGFNLCAPGSGLNGIILQQTPGDVPIAAFNVFGNEWKLGPSAQSIHPNLVGSELYASVANEMMTRVTYPLQSSLVGGAATTYYATFRLHAGGPASFNVTQFAACGQEMRVGLRRQDGSGSFGQQHTNTLSWFAPHSMQTFETSTTPATELLPSGSYAMNARLTTACTGGGPTAWQGTLHLRN